MHTPLPMFGQAGRIRHGRASCGIHGATRLAAGVLPIAGRVAVIPHGMSTFGLSTQLPAMMHSAAPRAGSVLLLLALLLPFGVACDSADTVLLNKAFVVGSWELDGVRDDAGDRTAIVRTAVTELLITFSQDDTFLLGIRYTPIVDQPDQELAGTYAVSATGQIVLTSSGVAVPFTAAIRGDDTMELSAPAALVALIIAAANVDLGLTGTVILTMERR